MHSNINVEKLVQSVMGSKINQLYIVTIANATGIFRITIEF